LKYQTNLMSKTVKNSWTERSIHFRKRKEELLSNLIERGEVRRLSNGKWVRAALSSVAKSVIHAIMC
jgi:hypothetical protein